MLTGVVCVAILMPLIKNLFYPGSLPETTAVKMFELITYIVGAISGYLGKSNETPKT